MARNKVLLVEDEAGVRFGIRDFLETKGYEVDEADSCERARELFRSSKPDVGIVDYMLPDGTPGSILLKSDNRSSAFPSGSM